MGMLPITTSTSDKLFDRINIDDFERHWTSKIGGFIDFCDLWLRCKLQKWTVTKWLEIDWEFANRNCYRLTHFMSTSSNFLFEIWTHWHAFYLFSVAWLKIAFSCVNSFPKFLHLSTFTTVSLISILCLKIHPWHFRLELEEGLLDDNNFWYEYSWHNLPSNDHSVFHLTQCLLLRYLGKADRVKYALKLTEKREKTFSTLSLVTWRRIIKV